MRLPHRFQALLAPLLLLPPEAVGLAASFPPTIPGRRASKNGTRVRFGTRRKRAGCAAWPWKSGAHMPSWPSFARCSAAANSACAMNGCSVAVVANPCSIMSRLSHNPSEDRRAWARRWPEASGFAPASVPRLTMSPTRISPRRNFIWLKTSTFGAGEILGVSIPRSRDRRLPPAARLDEDFQAALDLHDLVAGRLAHVLVVLGGYGDCRSLSPRR